MYNKLLMYYDRKETWTDEEKSLKIIPNGSLEVLENEVMYLLFNGHSVQ